MAELVDAPGSGPGARSGREGSTPFVRTQMIVTLSKRRAKAYTLLKPQMMDKMR